MSNLFKIKAKIFYLESSLRTLPISNGYRPLFDFGNNMKTSGSIILINNYNLQKGEQAEVLINFFSDEPLKNLSKDATFKFYEWPNIIGTGIIKEIIGW